MKNKKTPAIRFKGFTDDWEQRKFGEMAEYKKGPFGSALKKDMFVPRGKYTVKVYEQQNAINKNWQIERYFITKTYANKLSGFETHGGDIIVSCAGTIGEIYELPYNCEQGIINQALMRVRVDENVVDKKFYKLLFSNMIDDFSRERSNGSAMKNIPPFADLKTIIALLPLMKEQKEIGKFLFSLDKIITLHQRKLEKLKNFKKAMLEKMFPKNGEKTPEIRFQGFTDDWEQRKLSELATFSKGSGYSKVDLKKSGTPIILYGRLYTKYETVIRNVDTFADAKDGSVYSQGGEVIVPGSGETAEDISVASVVEKSRVLLGGDLNIIHPNEGIDSAFLALSISNGEPHNDMARRAQGKSVVHLHNEDLAQIELCYPSLSEQKQISDYFLSLDHLIALHQRKLEKLQQIKKAMLEKMFV